jgi:hypothetical protein
MRTHVTFFSDGTHVHHRKSGEMVHLQECEESKQIRRLLGLNGNKAFEASLRIFDEFDRQMQHLDRQMKATDEVFKEPRDLEDRIRIRMAWTPSQDPFQHPARGVEPRIRVGRSTSEKRSRPNDSAASIVAIAAIAIGVGYLGYKNAEAVTDFLRSVPGALQESGQAMWNFIQSSWPSGNYSYSCS